MFYVRINIGDINTKTEYLQKKVLFLINVQVNRIFVYIYTEIKLVIKWIAIVGRRLRILGIVSYKDERRN